MAILTATIVAAEVAIARESDRKPSVPAPLSKLMFQLYAAPICCPSRYAAIETRSAWSESGWAAPPERLAAVLEDVVHDGRIADPGQESVLIIH
jgi:hypothetical protein